MDDLLGIGKAVEALTDPVTDLLKRIAGPACDEIGLTLQDRVHVWRAKRAHKLGEKFLKSCQERGIEPKQVDLKILLPILNYASVEVDEDLHTMWANLLTNAADPAHDEVLPSFPDVLKQLTKRAALFLDAFYDLIQKQQTTDRDYALSYVGVQSVYLDAVRNPAPESEFKIVLDDLLRMGLVRTAPKVQVPYRAEREELYPTFGPTQANVLLGYILTDYGMAFVEACRRPSKRP